MNIEFQSPTEDVTEDLFFNIVNVEYITLCLLENQHCNV